MCVCVVDCCVYNSLHPIGPSPFVRYKVLCRIACLVVVVVICSTECGSCHYCLGEGVCVYVNEPRNRGVLLLLLLLYRYR